MDTAAKLGRPLEPFLARIAVAALIGLVVLPALLAPPASQISRSPASPIVAVWLLLAAVSTLWLVLEARSLTVALALRLSGRHASDPVGWMLSLGAVGLAQAILRRPFVAVVGGWTGAGVADIVFAAAILVVVVVTLAMLHVSAVPLVTSAARSALDALVPTVEPEEQGSLSSRPTDARSRPEPATIAVGEATAPLPTDAATLAAAFTVGEATVPLSAGETIAAALTVGDSTRPAATADGPDATRPGTLPGGSRDV